jgi:hypothetical protein
VSDEEQEPWYYPVPIGWPPHIAKAPGFPAVGVFRGRTGKGWHVYVYHRAELELTLGVMKELARAPERVEQQELFG